MIGSIPSRRKDFEYIVAVYKKDIAEQILNRDTSNSETETDMKVVEILNVGGKRAHAVEGFVDILVILNNSVDIVKLLKYRHLDLTKWDWTPLSMGEIEVEAEIYNPRQITTMQYEESMNVLGLSVVWSTASNMLPSALSIELPESFQSEGAEVTLDPAPEPGNEAGKWKVKYKGAGLITKCMAMTDKNGAQVKKDVPLGAKVTLRLNWTGTAEPTPSDWPVLPLWVQCPEQIAYNQGDESWTPSQPTEKETVGAFQYPQRQGAFYVEQTDPTTMSWVNVRWKTPGNVKGRPTMLDARKDDLDRRTGRASRPGSHKSRKKKDGAFSSSAEKPLGYSGKEPANQQPPHNMTRKLQEAWKGAIEGKEARAASKQPGASAGGVKAREPPCWKVASKALHTGVDMSELLIQLSAEGELVKRGAEASGIMPHRVIEASCGSAACKKEPCISALKQRNYTDYENRKTRQDDPELTQMAEVNQSGGATETQTPGGGSMAGGKRNDCGGAQGSAQKKTGDGSSPFRRSSQNPDFDGMYCDDTDRTTWPNAANSDNPFSYAPQQPTMQAQMAGIPMQAQMAPPAMQAQMHAPPFQAPRAQMAAATMMQAPQAMYPNVMPQGGFVQILPGQPIAGMPGQAAQYTSAFETPQEIAMTDQEVAEWKHHIPALNRVTPAYKVVSAAQSRSPWSNLSESSEAQLIALKEAYNAGTAGLSWERPMWVRDVGFALLKTEVIGDMHQLEPLITWCVQADVVKSHDKTKCRISLTKELPLRMLNAASSGGRGATSSGKGAAGNYMARGGRAVQARGKGKK